MLSELHEGMPREPDSSKALLSLAARVPALAGLPASVLQQCIIMSDVPPVLSLVPETEGGGVSRWMYILQSLSELNLSL